MTKSSKSGDAIARIEEQLTLLQQRVLKLESRGASRAESFEMPPLPKRTGKKYQGSKKDVRVRIDEILHDLLTNQANADFGGNQSACLDMVLWNFYGQPRLSFEVQHADESE